MDFKLNWYQQVFILLITCHYIKVEAAIVEFQPEGIQCACAGDKLIYNCSVVGGTATRWKGSLIDCPLDVITLRHSQFGSNQAIETCNNGDITGYGIGVVNNCYVSQLNVTVRESFNNKTVQCILNSNEGTRIISESVLSVTSATNLYPPPNNLYLADVQPGELVFNWTPAISNCSTPQYSITSDCGTCPAVTNATTAICSNLQLTTNTNLCSFRVSSHACDLSGNPSSPTIVTLRVPDVPRVEIVPSYSYDGQALERLFIIMNQTMQDQLYISGNISGSPISYSAYGSNPFNGIFFNFTFDYEEGSGYPIKLSPSYCSRSAIINITISAANKLGEGPRSSPFIIECANNFVQVVYSETTFESTISCIFLNVSDTSEKTCCVTYQLCDHNGIENPHNCSRVFPYSILLEVSDHSMQRYCYTITASNETYTIRVDGTFITEDSNNGGNTNTSAAIVGSVIVLFFLLLLLLCVVLTAIIVKRRWRPQQCGDKVIPLSYIHPLNLLKQHLTPYCLPSTLTLHEVNGDYELQQFITGTLGAEFKGSHTYYEFTNEVENIPEGQEVLLQDKKNTKKWFRLAPPEEVAAGGLKLYGEGIARSSFGNEYRVFIQNFGSGAQHVCHGSWILYNQNVDEHDARPIIQYQ